MAQPQPGYGFPDPNAGVPQAGYDPQVNKFFIYIFFKSIFRQCNNIMKLGNNIMHKFHSNKANHL